MRWPLRHAIPTVLRPPRHSTAPGWSAMRWRARICGSSKIKGEVHIACAEIDDLAPMPMVEELRGLFVKAGSPGELEVYPGVHHGFAFLQRKVYDKAAAERHWERLIALYRRRFG